MGWTSVTHSRVVTSERVLFKAGPEFGDREGHTRHRTRQYGLRSSEHVWHDKLADVLRDMGFKPSLSEEDIWMRKEITTNTWRYTWMTSPSLARIQRPIDELTTTHKFKLKGTGPITYHLVATIFAMQMVHCVLPLFDTLRKW
jgi:hypothetical protein